MSCWHRLNLSTKGALSIDVPKFCLTNTERADVYIPDHGGIWTFGKDEIFTHSWMDYVQSTIPYIEITGALVFWRAPGYQHPGAHIDVAPASSPSLRDIEYESNGFHSTNSSASMDKQDFYPVVAAYNFTLDPQDSSAMTWFEPLEKPSQEMLELKKFTNAVHYDEVPLEKLREIDRCTIGSDNLVLTRTNVLHSVDMGNRERWSISARAVMNWSSWDHAVSTLEPWIKQ